MLDSTPGPETLQSSLRKNSRTGSGSPPASRSARSVKIRTSDSSLLPPLRKHSFPKEKKIPRILAHYQIWSYVIYSFCIIIFLIYLIYVAILLYTPVFYIQYEPVIKLYEYNSYNLICPFLGIIFCLRFMYHVKARVKLEEGDFFGLIGIIIFFCMIMCYDGTGIINLYQDRLKYLDTPGLHEKHFFDNETNELAWQYAWSTRPICARTHARHELEKSEKLKKVHQEEKTIGPAFLSEEDNPISSRMLDTLLRPRTSSVGSDEDADRGCSGHAKVDEKDQTVDQITYTQVCNCSAFAVDKQPSRKWMILMQKTYKCCGPRGYKDWKERVRDVETTCRGSKNGPLFGQGCSVPFNKFLADSLFTTIWFMFFLIVVFIVIMVTACCHFAAMKYEDTGVIHEYSLLDLTEPDDRRVVEIKRQKPVSKLIYSDAVRGILQSSNLRAQKRKNSTPSTVNFDTSTRVNPGHFKNISHTVMSTFGKKFNGPIRKDNTTGKKS